MSDCLCDQCAALCCRYFALPIDNPKTARQFDDIRWYLCHENVVIFIEKKQWYLGIMSRCKHLQTDNRCGIYETRPKVCRGYSTDNCDYHGGEYDFEKLFTSAEQLREYALAYLLKRRAKRRVKNRDSGSGTRDSGSGKRDPEPAPRRRVGVKGGVKGHPSLHVLRNRANAGLESRIPSPGTRNPMPNGSTNIRLPVLRG